MVLRSQFQATSSQHHTDSLIRWPFCHDSVTRSASSYPSSHPTMATLRPPSHPTCGAVSTSSSVATLTAHLSSARTKALSASWEGVRSPSQSTLGASRTQLRWTALSQHTSTPTGQFRWPSHGGEDAHRLGKAHQTPTILGGVL